MGLFKNLFSAKNESNENQNQSNGLSVYKLTKVEQLASLKEISNEKLVLIFKHSTRCGISRMVWNQFQAQANFPEDQVALFYLDLLSYRSVSDAVAEEFRVFHQSPQLIILSNEEVVHHASHSSITASSIEEYLAD